MEVFILVVTVRYWSVEYVVVAGLTKLLRLLLLRPHRQSPGNKILRTDAHLLYVYVCFTNDFGGGVTCERK